MEVAFLFVSGLVASANQSVSLGWNASPTPDVGYAIYYGLASSNHVWRLDAGTNLTAMVTGLLENQTYYFAAVAYDTNQAESDFSNEVSYLVPDAVNLVLLMGAAPTRVNVGGDVNYTLLVSNVGPNTASSVTATALLSSGQDYVGASSTLGTFGNSNGLVSFALGSLPAEAAGTFTVTATARSGAALTNTAVVSANSATGNPSTNAASVWVPVNYPPVLPAQPDRTITALTTLVVTNTATSTNTGAGALTYTLLMAPAGAGIDNLGVITWTPGPSPGPSTNVFTTVVTDDSVPPLSATNSFVVYVSVPDIFVVPPVFQSVSLSDGSLLLTWSAQPGRVYQLQGTSDLGQTNWTNLGSVVMATNDLAGCSTAVGSDTQRFYRIVRLP